MAVLEEATMGCSATRLAIAWMLRVSGEWTRGGIAQIGWRAREPMIRVLQDPTPATAGTLARLWPDSA